jgi:hypothetical protein
MDGEIEEGSPAAIMVAAIAAKHLTEDLQKNPTVKKALEVAFVTGGLFGADLQRLEDKFSR